ncbi:MAG: hypothetical protein ACR2OZ_03690 [Verrucomicrobiales bacterium]
MITRFWCELRYYKASRPPAAAQPSPFWTRTCGLRIGEAVVVELGVIELVVM